MKRFVSSSSVCAANIPGSTLGKWFILVSVSRYFLMPIFMPLLFGGVFPVLIYDNLTTAVQKVFAGQESN